MKKNKITVVRGHGRLTGPAKDGVFTIDVTAEDKGKGQDRAAGGHAGEGEEGRARHRLRRAHAAGLQGRRHHPDQHTRSSRCPTLPKSLIVIGSGAVGVEFASIFKSFGAEVTILEALPRIVPVEDEEVSKELTRAYKKRGIDVNVSCKVEKIEKNKGGVKVSFTDAARQAAGQGGREGSGRRRPRPAHRTMSASTR